MDYLGALGPIFSYAAHLKLTADGRPGPDAIRYLEAMLAQTRAERRPSPDFDRAWLALCAWLDETFDLGCTARHFPGAVPAEAFFDALDPLLLADGDEDDEPADAGVLAVYAAALDLGFTGRRDPARLEACRQRCKRLARRPERPVVPLPPPSSSPALALAGAAVFWVVPLAVTVLLYSVYRFLLNGLYASVVG